MATNESRPHPPSARAVPQKKARLSSVAHLREALRFGGHDDVREIVVSECTGSDKASLSGDLVLRVLSLPPIANALCVLDLSFNELPDAFWTQTDWSKAPRWPSLTSVNLASNRFSEISLPVVRSVLARCPALKQFDLSVNAVGYDLTLHDPTQHDVSHLFACFGSLESLDLSCLHVNDAHVSTLLESSSLTRSIRRLYLRSNNLTEISATAIANAIGSNKLCALQTLSLAGNTIGDSGLGALAFVVEEAAALETLDVDENKISDAGLRTLFHVINGFQRRFPLRFLHVNYNKSSRQSAQLVDIIQLKLQEKIIETHVTANVVEGSQNNDNTENYRDIQLSGKYLRTTLHMASLLTDHFVSIALTSIRHCDLTWESLEELDLSGNTIGTPGAWEIGSFLSLLPPKLRSLNLADNQINDEGIVGLADGLEWNAALAELNLNDNHITDEGAKQLYLKAFTSNLQRKILLSEGNPLTSECKVMVAAISQAYDLRKRFAKEFAHLEKLDFVGQRLRQYGAAAIAECLLTTPGTKCVSLDLSNNMLGDEGAVEVAKMLRGYTSLTKLDLSFNEIGDAGAVALADALRANATLTSFSLHSSIPGSSTAKPKLSEVGLIALAQSLERHKALTSLDLRDNVMPAALIPALVHTLQRNTRIQKFNGSSAAVFLSRNES